jgi:ribonuclease J
MEDLHVSGHGSQGDLMLMLSTVGPKYVMPIGGTYKHMMQYRRLAEELGYRKKHVLIPEEGQILEFRPHEDPKVVETHGLEQVMVDGLGVGDVGTVVLRDRQQIATEGIVVIVVPVEEATGKVTSEPDIISRGFVYMKESGELLDKVRQVVKQSLRLKKGRIIDWQFVRKMISEQVAEMLEKETGRYPLIVPVIIEV